MPCTAQALNVTFTVLHEIPKCSPIARWLLVGFAASYAATSAYEALGFGPLQMPFMPEALSMKLVWDFEIPKCTPTSAWRMLGFAIA